MYTMGVRQNDVRNDTFLRWLRCDLVMVKELCKNGFSLSTTTTTEKENCSQHNEDLFFGGKTNFFHGPHLSLTKTLMLPIAPFDKGTSTMHAHDRIHRN